MTYDINHRASTALAEAAACRRRPPLPVRLDVQRRPGDERR